MTLRMTALSARTIERKARASRRNVSAAISATTIGNLP
jgi:hypothetical protein